MHDTPGRVPACLASMANGTLIYVSRKEGGWHQDDVNVFLIDIDRRVEKAVVRDQPNFFPNGAISLDTDKGKLWVPSEFGRVSAFWEGPDGRVDLEVLNLTQFSIVEDTPLLTIHELEPAGV